MTKEKRIVITGITLVVVLGALFTFYGYDKEEVITNSETTTGEQAIASVKKTYPKYQDYPSDNFPLKTVEAVKFEDGWRVGMYIMGSGVPGILSADCFIVSRTGVVSENGFFNGEGPAADMNLTTCTPKE